jgi:hypothetical protein
MPNANKPSLLDNLLRRSSLVGDRPRQTPRLFQAKSANMLAQAAAAEALMPKLVADMEARLTEQGFVKVSEYADEQVWTTKPDPRTAHLAPTVMMDFDEMEMRVIHSMGGPEAVKSMMCNVSPTGRLRSFPATQPTPHQQAVIDQLRPILYKED